MDYIGVLGAKLRDLRGFATLAYELIQNADDAPGASSMSFDVRQDALVVENDGVFSDCGHVEEAGCPWKDDPSKGYRCDFHRFRSVASGDKRDQTGTTGAFGIGFIAVYQITDRPELISGGRHWTLLEERSEAERIEVCPGCPRCQGLDLPGTCFFFPWASDPQSRLRQALRAEAVSEGDRTSLLNELESALPTAMLFLKNLQKITVKATGYDRQCFERVEDGDNLLVSDGESDRVWHLVRGNFNEGAEGVRQRHPRRIEDKRTAEVVVAIPAAPIEAGLLCACLPTQHDSGLPFHVNADFFPTNDRKRIIFESDYQSEWNRLALKAAAAALGSSLARLPSLIPHQRLWDLLLSLKNVADDAARGRREKTLGEFWKVIEPALTTSPVVFSTRNEWKVPADTVVLLQKEEAPAVPVLEEIGLFVVHEDLRPHQGLLRQVGTPLLDIPRLSHRLADLGLTQRTGRKEWPACLHKAGVLRSLWREIALLLEHPRSSAGKEQDRRLLAGLAIALGRDGALWPCRDAHRADGETLSLFQALDPRIPFLVDSEPDFDPLSGLCPSFDALAAIRSLEQIGPEGLRTAWKTGRLDLKRLFAWLEVRRGEIEKSPEAKAALGRVSIFPASGELRPLDELALPGGFEDPLGLATLVDLEALGHRRDFLRDLGMQELNFGHYAKVHLPNALQQPDIAPDKRRQAAVLLGNRVGEIEDDAEVRTVLVETPLVECTDGSFRQPGIVYFRSDAVRAVLGDSVPSALIPKDHEAALHHLYEWLGVAAEPRFEDLVRKVRDLTRETPTPSTRQAVQEVFAHLGKRLRDEELPDVLDELRTEAWLPARGKDDRWYRPDEVYAVFRDYLFESQALFLDIPRALQNASTEFLLHLTIETTPTPTQVVKHLLSCAEAGRSVNQEVYRFLNDNAQDRSIGDLIGKRCLLIENDTYIEPAQVFWGEHPFGQYRRRLGSGLRQYESLFARLGVHETPDHQDALRVLREVSAEYGKGNTPLDEESHGVVMACWRLLEAALAAESLSMGELAALQKLKCVPNNKRLLNPPAWMFFENRAGLAAKFEDFLSGNVIPRPLAGAKAMTAAGVQSLGTAVQTHLIECVDPGEDGEVYGRVRERRGELARVIEAQVSDANAEEILDRLEQVRFESAEALLIRYSLHAFNRVMESEPEPAPALFQRDDGRLLFVRRAGQPPWPAIARELAAAIFPDEDPGRIASGLKEVLAADTDAEARSVLDELGFATLDATVREPVEEGQTVEALGGRSEATGDVTAEEAVKLLLGPDAPAPTPPPPGLASQDESAGGAGESRTATGQAKSGAAPRSGRRGKLRSYVVENSQGGDDGSDSEGASHRSRLEEAGIERVVAFERMANRCPEVKPPRHPGYDIESKDENGNVLRYIEVKAVAGKWDGLGVGMTATEFRKARDLCEKYWLYVVERVEQTEARIHRIQDPARRVGEFFFDDGWRGAAEIR